jgi:hypothetical protein
MSRTIKKEQLYIQEEHNMFINPSPLIPLPSVSFQCKTFRTMLVRGKMIAGGAAAPACKRTTLSQQIDAKKRTRFGAGRGQGEGRFKFLTLKNLDVID